MKRTFKKIRLTKKISLKALLCITSDLYTEK